MSDVGGRPTKYSDDLAVKLLDRISHGESVIAICDDESMPARSSVYKWLGEIEGFSDKYHEAKRLSGAYDADHIQDIAQKTLEGKYDPSAARVAMTGLMWSAALKEPRRYGDRIHTEHSGSIDQLSEDQIDAKLQSLLSKYANS